MAKSLVEYYREQSISPVRQHLGSLEAHFCRRGGLYQQLGIGPNALRDRAVLEVGPGSGYNSLFTASLRPARYVLVEGNPQGVKDIDALFSEHSEFAGCIEVKNCLLEEFTEYESFDFVFCEGVLGQVPNPEEFLIALAKYVRHQGVLVVTVVDYISTLGDMLRRLFAHLYVSPEMTLQQKIEVLLPVFSPQLAKLNGMTRRHDDWITDNLLVPGSIARFFSFPEAIETLADNFDFYAVSPHFVQDWRWYKQIAPEKRQFNERAIESYWSNTHNFLNYQELYPPRPAELNKQLLKKCKDFAFFVGRYEAERSSDSFSSALKLVTEIVADVSTFSPKSAEALRQAAALLEKKEAGKAAFSSNEQIGAFIGRAQQYLSLIRRA